MKTDRFTKVCVPRLETCDREAQQRFANVVDVLVARTAGRLELINTTG